MSAPRIGFIGLGLMGAAMVQRLQECGYNVTVTANRNRAQIEAAVERGATEVGTPGEVAANVDIVMLCVDTSDAVESIMLGADGVIEHLRKGVLVIDFGTSLPTSTRKLSELVAARGASMMDAPLGRTPAHAALGQLNIMAAGTADDFARAKPVLEDLAENLFHLGPLGTGHQIKLLNNFVGQTQALAVAQAFAVADKVGVPRQAFYDVVSAGPVSSGILDFVKAYAIDGDPNQLEFSLDNARKDVGYFVTMAESAGFDSTIGKATFSCLDDAVKASFGQRHVSEIVDFFAGQGVENAND
jgi:2-hydroxy-3-oxopropionate reductase